MANKVKLLTPEHFNGPSTQIRHNKNDSSLKQPSLTNLFSQKLNIGDGQGFGNSVKQCSSSILSQPQDFLSHSDHLIHNESNDYKNLCDDQFFCSLPGSMRNENAVKEGNVIVQRKFLTPDSFCDIRQKDKCDVNILCDAFSEKVKLNDHYLAKNNFQKQDYFSKNKTLYIGTLSPQCNSVKSNFNNTSHNESLKIHISPNANSKPVVVEASQKYLKLEKLIENKENHEVKNEGSSSIDCGNKIHCEEKETPSKFSLDAQKSIVPSIGVFWDIENCRIPKGLSASHVVQAIRNKFFDGFKEVEFMCVCDTVKENSKVLEELNEAQVNIIHVGSFVKNAADDKLLQCMRRFSDIHGYGATIIVITGDSDFAMELYDLRYRKKLYVILIHNEQAQDSLKLSAHETALFSDVIQDVRFKPFKPRMHGLSRYVFVWNLPTAMFDSSLIRRRLQAMSANCGGNQVLVRKGYARIRFQTPFAAYRARSRIEGVDVYGSRVFCSFNHRGITSGYSGDIDFESDSANYNYSTRTHSSYPSSSQSTYQEKPMYPYVDPSYTYGPWRSYSDSERVPNGFYQGQTKVNQGSLLNNYGCKRDDRFRDRRSPDLGVGYSENYQFLDGNRADDYVYVECGGPDGSATGRGYATETSSTSGSKAPSPLTVLEDENGERVIQLTRDERLCILGEQIFTLVKNSPERSIKADVLLSVFTRFYGYALKPDHYDCCDVFELIQKLESYVKIERSEGDGAELVTLVDRSASDELWERCRAILWRESSCSLPADRLARKLSDEGMACHGEIENELSDYIEKVEMDGKWHYRLAPLQVFLRDALVLLSESGGRMALANFETAFFNRFGVSCNPGLFGFSNLLSLFTSLDSFFGVKGKKTRSYLVLNKAALSHLPDSLPPNNSTGVLQERRKWNNFSYTSVSPGHETAKSQQGSKPAQKRGPQESSPVSCFQPTREWNKDFSGSPVIMGLNHSPQQPFQQQPVIYSGSPHTGSAPVVWGQIWSPPPYSVISPVSPAPYVLPTIPVNWTTVPVVQPASTPPQFAEAPAAPTLGSPVSVFSLEQTDANEVSPPSPNALPSPDLLKTPKSASD